ncbi:MAG: ABC transporter ATP-binding protein, partial [Sphaerochaetaceae bacterium]|nr:ABC transporter ATP-binding protein [Sphaerochaetaceae bacterium]
MSRVLEINNLTVKDGKGYILKDISLSLDSNETMAFIGESGSGKTMTLKAILSILPTDVEKVEGDVLIDGTELYNLKKDEKRIKLGTTVGFVPQNTVNYLHPLLRIKDQMTDGYITFHGRKKKEEALNKARKSLEEVGIKDVERVLSSYPSELSGG